MEVFLVRPVCLKVGTIVRHVVVVVHKYHAIIDVPPQSSPDIENCENISP